LEEEFEFPRERLLFCEGIWWEEVLVGRGRRRTDGFADAAFDGHRSV
jgi:hypothetical protein